jgi:pumilio family protein 6
MAVCNDLVFEPNRMTNRSTDKVAASKALLQPASAAYPSNDESLPHPLDLAHTSRLYKTLLQGGHFSQSSHAVETTPYFSASIFAHQWVEIVGQDVTIASATGAGAFVVSALCDQLVADDALSEARRTAQSWFGKEEREKIGTWEGRGKAVLEKSVDSLLASGA